jgi:hypothetical protein
MWAAGTPVMKIGSAAGWISSRARQLTTACCKSSRNIPNGAREAFCDPEDRHQPKTADPPQVPTMGAP